ncbi:unnamed protein product [marine sediment metagenome]|uniref:Uncharacterized protein n=1 Tax=marine sediment metagenome TaxID=412755 RepID=X1BI17_9ZZZZ
MKRIITEVNLFVIISIPITLYAGCTGKVSWWTIFLIVLTQIKFIKKY